MASSIDEFLTPYNSEVQELILKARLLILALIPEAIEMLDLPSQLIGYGFGRKYADLICGVMPYKSYVNIIFAKGTELSDPDGLLEGTGKHARHVKIMRPEDLEAPGLAWLIQAAGEATRH